MITPDRENKVRVSLTLDRVDVDLLDRLAALVDSNRSEQVREMLQQVRPMMQATVQAFEAAESQRSQLFAAVTNTTSAELDAILPDVERISSQFLGVIARLEGYAAASAADSEAADPRSGNHGGQVPRPPHSDTPSDLGREEP